MRVIALQKTTRLVRRNHGIARVQRRIPPIQRRRVISATSQGSVRLPFPKTSAACVRSHRGGSSSRIQIGARQSDHQPQDRRIHERNKAIPPMWILSHSRTGNYHDLYGTRTQKGISLRS